jgi:hypothetical protein
LVWLTDQLNLPFRLKKFFGLIRPAALFCTADRGDESEIWENQLVVLAMPFCLASARSSLSKIKIILSELLTNLSSGADPSSST